MLRKLLLLVLTLAFVLVFLAPLAYRYNDKVLKSDYLKMTSK